MSKYVTERWLDLGELGQHQAEIVAILGEFPYIAVCDVTVKGERVNLIPLLPRDTESIILEEIEIESRVTEEDIADAMNDQRKLEAA